MTVQPRLPGEAPFYIPATDAPARPRRNLKHNDTFAVFDSHGDFGASAGGQDGLFDCDTRYLSHLELLIDGVPAPAAALGDQRRQPQLLRRSDQPRHLRGRQDRPAQGHRAHRAHDLPVRRLPARARSASPTTARRRSSFTLSLTFASDFADIFEVRGIRRKRRGQAWSRVLGAGGVVLSYRGLGSACCARRR